MRLVSNLSRIFLVQVVVLSGALTVCNIHGASAQSAKISPDIVVYEGRSDVLLTFHSYGALDAETLRASREDKASAVFAHLSAMARRQQAAVIRYLEEHGIQYRSFCVANAIHAVVPAAQLQALADFPAVKSINPNPTIAVSKTRRGGPTQRSAGPEWGLLQIRADSAWALGYRGQGVVVGGGDTGYDWQHPALQGKYRGWDGDSADHNHNWHDAVHEISPLHGDSVVAPDNNPCGLDVLMPCDDTGHGTHTMGTMAGSDEDDIIGVAPQAKWIGCRNMERGYGSPATYLECFEWFLAPTDVNGENPDPSKAPHVINNSWSCPEMEGCNPENFEVLREAVDNLRMAGIVVVVSAGNSGGACSSVSTPAAMFDESFTVGATNRNDTIASFSARGPVLADSSGRRKPDVVAPGVQVRSAWLGDGYLSASGTSAAGPHVAGTVALMISANPALAGQVELIEDILELTAVPLSTSQECGEITGTEFPNNTYGYGRIDALAAVKQALLMSHTNGLLPEKPEVAISPNPGSGVFRISLPARIADAHIRVLSASGQLILAENRSFPASLDLSEMPPGLYIVSVHTSTEYFTGKLILHSL